MPARPAPRLPGPIAVPNVTMSYLARRRAGPLRCHSARADHRRPDHPVRAEARMRAIEAQIVALRRCRIACGRGFDQCRPGHGCRLSGGEASDYTAADDLVDLPYPPPKGLLAGKGGDGFWENLLLGGILPVTPLRSHRKMRARADCRRDKKPPPPRNAL